MAKIKVLVIEDNRLLREGIVQLLQRAGDYKVIVKPEDGEVIEHLLSIGESPHLVLLDLGLQAADSLKLMAQLKENFPETRVIAMDVLPNHVEIVEFVKAGGSGFILKDASPDDYISTIKAVMNGIKVLPPMLTKTLHREIAEAVVKSGKNMLDSSNQLTNREREIVLLISEGLSNKEIAQRLHLATFTVKSHIHNILGKLALASRLQIAAFARKESPI